KTSSSTNSQRKNHLGGRSRVGRFDPPTGTASNASQADDSVVGPCHSSRWTAYARRGRRNVLSIPRTPAAASTNKPLVTTIILHCTTVVTWVDRGEILEEVRLARAPLSCFLTEPDP